MTVEDVLTWEKRFKKLPDNCCVAMMSGWAQHVDKPDKFTGKDAGGAFHFPGFSPELAEWLLKERKVLGIASDTLSLDNGPSKDFKTHHIWLPSGRWGLEKRRQSGTGAAVRRNARCGRAQGQGCNRRSGAADRADLTCHDLTCHDPICDDRSSRRARDRSFIGCGGGAASTRP